MVSGVVLSYSLYSEVVVIAALDISVVMLINDR